MLRSPAITLTKYGAASCLALFLLLFCNVASAHLMSAGNGVVNILSGKANLLVGVPVAFFKGVDSNQDGLLQPEEIRTQRDQIIEQLSRAVLLKIDGQAAEVVDDQIIASMHVDQQNSTPQIEWLRQYQFKDQNKLITAELVLSNDFLKNQYLFKVKQFDEQEIVVFSQKKPSHVFFNHAWATFQSFVLEGWEHIVSGHDHIVFIMVLLASRIAIRRWLWLLITFTLAHGTTYTLASFGWLQVQSAYIEPVIAVTIIVTAVLSLFKIHLNNKLEALLVFSFGLFHGLGFASAMNTQLNGGRFPVSSVIGFNFGVELGQLAIATLLGFVFWVLRKHAIALERLRHFMIWFAFCTGAFWLFERI